MERSKSTSHAPIKLAELDFGERLASPPIAVSIPDIDFDDTVPEPVLKLTIPDVDFDLAEAEPSPKRIPDLDFGEDTAMPLIPNIDFGSQSVPGVPLSFSNSPTRKHSEPPTPVMSASPNAVKSKRGVLQIPALDFSGTDCSIPIDIRGRNIEATSYVPPVSSVPLFDVVSSFSELIYDLTACDFPKSTCPQIL